MAPLIFVRNVRSNFQWELKKARGRVLRVAQKAANWGVKKRARKKIRTLKGMTKKLLALMVSDQGGISFALSPCNPSLMAKKWIPTQQVKKYRIAGREAANAILRYGV